MTEISQEDCARALVRIGQTPDGRLLYLWLQKELMGVPTSDKSGALRQHNGRRSLAAQLMAMMAEGIESSGGDAKPADRPLVFRLAQSRRVADSRFARSLARRGPGEPDAAAE